MIKPCRPILTLKKPTARDQTQDLDLHRDHTASPKKMRAAERKAILAVLHQRWPEIFDPLNRQPLAIGCRRYLQTHLAPQFSKIAVSRTLKHWTDSRDYLSALSHPTAIRVHPDPSVPPEPVSDRHRAFAAERLARIAKTRSAKRSRKTNVSA